MKMTKKTLAILLAALMALSTFTVSSVVFASTTDTGIESGNSEPALVNETVTEGTETATEDTWGNNDGTNYLISTVADMKSFNSLVTSGNHAGKTFKLGADIDMTGVTWTKGGDFHGTIDGAGHTIYNFSMSGAAGTAMFNIFRGTMKNINFVGGTITGTGDNTATLVTMFAGSPLFENVYIENTVSGTNYVAGFAVVQQSPSANTTFRNCVVKSTINGKVSLGGFVAEYRAGTMKFENCISKATINQASGSAYIGGFIARVCTNAGLNAIFTNCVSEAIINPGSDSAGGFVGNSIASTTTTFTDCAFMGRIAGDIERKAGFVGSNTGNIKLERCVSAGAIQPRAVTEGKTYHQRWGALVHLDNVNTAANSTVEIIDCYVAAANYANGDVARAVSGSDSRFNTFNITVKYGTTTVYDKDAVAYADLVDINNAFEYLAKGNDAILTTENFTGICPVLAQNGWIITNKTVNYVYGDAEKTVPVILTKDMAEEFGYEAVATPIDSTYWHVNDNGDGTCDVRFLGTISVADAASYKNVGIKISVTLKRAEGDTKLLSGAMYTTEKVFKTFTIGENSVTADEGDYLFAVNMTGFSKDATYEIEFISFITDDDADLTIIYDYDGATTITIENGVVAA